MPDGKIPVQTAENLFGEDVCHQAHVFVQVQRKPI